jgi:hypothetical protein
MIIITLTFWQKLKLLFGWYVQVEIWPRSAQCYWHVVLAPWEQERIFRNPERHYQNTYLTGGY